MPADLVIGLDSSTSACKAIAFDKRGHVVAEGRASIPLKNPKMGWFEQDVADWRGSAVTALKQLTKKISKDRVAAIAISNQRESFAQFDEKGRALRPATLWLDERSHDQVQTISEEIGAKKLHKISGKPPDVTPCLYRCRWFADRMPQLWAKVHKTTEVHGVLTHLLTGEWKTSIASADPMGLIDVATYDWSNVLLKAARLKRQQLPTLYQPGTPMGEVSELAAKLTGLRPGTAVVAGGGDGQCAGTGINIFMKGRAYLNLGTASVSGSYSSGYAIDPAFRSMVAVGEQGFVFESLLRTGTFLVGWLTERIFHQNPTKDPSILRALEEEAKATPVGSRGLVMLPYFSGIMTPYWDSHGRGVFAGLSNSHTRADLYRAMMEGIALEHVMMTNRAASAAKPIHHYAIVGGGSKSDLWCQIIADASGRDVKRLETAEASALGAAMAAAKGAGWFKTITEASAAMSGKPSKVFRPRTKNAKAYAELLEIYQDLWPKIASWNARLQQFSDRHP